MGQQEFPKVGHRGTLDPQIQSVLKDNPDFRLGGTDFLAERGFHSEFLGIHNISASQQESIDNVELTAIRGPAGTIPIRILYPGSARKAQKSGTASALVYFHGGGYTVGSADEFENGLRILAEDAAIQIYVVDFHLAPEWKFPTQLEEYLAVLGWLEGNGGKTRGVDPNKICGGGDSAGGNMTAAIALRARDNKAMPFRAMFLLYPEPRMPFDTVASEENNSGYYLECNGIYSFADHYLPRGIPALHPYVSPGMQPVERLKNLPPTAIFTCGYDPLRDVGIEYADKLSQAGNKVVWKHFPTLTHGFLQFVPWSQQCKAAAKEVAAMITDLVHGE